MSEFNGKKYYGFSMNNDPSLLTTTRNFEFRYTRPENLDRLIQKVQNDENSENKGKKIFLPKFSKLKKGNSRALPQAFHTCDDDVETHMSRRDLHKVRDLSEHEIDQLIGKAMSTVSMVSGKVAMAAQQQMQDIENGLCSAMTSGRFSKMDIAEYSLPQPQCAEVEENQGRATLSTPHPRESHVMMESPDDTPFMSITNLDQTMMNQQQEQEMQAEMKRQQLFEPQNQARGYHSSNTSSSLDLVPQNMPPQNVVPPQYFVEDSDYEYEMLRRPGYTRYCQPRPPVDDMNLSSESSNVPKFIEVEPHIPCMDLSFLKNSKPIRYTDQTDEVVEEDRQHLSEMLVFMKGMAHMQNEDRNRPQSAGKKTAKKEAHDRKEPLKKKMLPFKPTAPSLTCRTSHSHRKIVKQPMACSPTNSPKSNKSRSPRTPNYGRNKPLKLKNVVMTKSLEELKMEKMTLFSKMNGTQERIIEILDKLRMNLLEACVPDNSYERNRRQKNAMEFSVRFSRNFLYPLRGMIDYLYNTTPETLNSSSSNEACMRVAAIYALMLQSLQTYQRQLRFFIMDQVPQKLPPLIDMLRSTTTLCLEKDVFDKNDPIIDCLLKRCDKFMCFLDDLQNERYISSRDNYKNKNRNEKLKPSLHEKYDLKMFMNDLNMYEPKLVPKRQSTLRISHKGSLAATTSSTNTTARKRSKRVRRATNDVQIPHSSKMALTKAAEDAIATHIQSLDYGNPSDLLTSVQNLTKIPRETVQNKDSSEPLSPLNRAVIEALQMVTKQQVREVLEPIIQTLGTALDKKNNSETIETIIKGMNKKKIPTTEEQNKKRHDAKNNRKQSKVHEGKLDSASTMSTASASFNAPKNTDKSTESSSTLRSSNKNSRSDGKSYSDRYTDNNDDDVVTAVGSALVDSDDLDSNEGWESGNEDEPKPEKPRKDLTEAALRRHQQAQLQPQKRVEQRLNKRDEEMRQQEESLRELQELQLHMMRQKEQEEERMHSMKMKKQQKQQQEQFDQEQRQLQLHQLQLKQRQRHDDGQKPKSQQQHQQQLNPKQPQQQQQQQPQIQRTAEKPTPRIKVAQQQQSQTRHSKQQRSSLKKSSHSRTNTILSSATTTAVNTPKTNEVESAQNAQQRRQQRPPPPCIKARSLRICKKRGSQLRSPPPVPNATPLTSARSDDPDIQQSDVEATETERTNLLVELPCTETNLNTQFNTEYLDCGDSAAEGVLSYRSDKSAAELAPTLKPEDAAAAVNAIAAALDKINGTHSARAQSLLQNGFIQDFLTKCLMSAKMPAAAAVAADEPTNNYNENVVEDEGGANANANDDDDYDEEEDEIDYGDIDDGVAYNECSDVASYVSTSRKQKKESSQLQQPRQENPEQSFDEQMGNLSPMSDAQMMMQQVQLESMPQQELLKQQLRMQQQQNQQYLHQFLEQQDHMRTSQLQLMPPEQQPSNRNTREHKALTKDLVMPKRPQQMAPMMQQQQFETNPIAQKTFKQLLMEQAQAQAEQMQTPQRLEPQQFLQNLPADGYYQAAADEQRYIGYQKTEQKPINLPKPSIPRDQRQNENQYEQQQSMQKRSPLNEMNKATQPGKQASPTATNPLGELFMDIMDRKAATRPRVDLKVENMVKARDQFLQLCNKNRFYSNPTYADPWKVFSSLSTQLATDIVNSVENDFGVGVSKFVDDFLEMETHN